MVSANRLRARTLAERHTIADSKRAFHQAFPHVIAPLYRRVADELLVELHLLSHQTAFEANNLFAIGLNTVFDRFTQGIDLTSTQLHCCRAVQQQGLMLRS